MSGKHIVEPNVRLVELSNDTCLVSDFQEEANHVDNVEVVTNSKANDEESKKGK